MIFILDHYFQQPNLAFPNYFYTYRIIPNKRAGRGDELGGAFIMCTKMLICISRPRRRH